MTEATIAMPEHLHKLGMDEDRDSLRESVRVMSQMLMELEVEQEAGAVRPVSEARRGGNLVLERSVVSFERSAKIEIASPVRWTGSQ